MSSPIAVVWFRRDLRLHDNAALAAALASGLPVLPLFIFDPLILGRLEDRDDKRVEFIHRTLVSMNNELKLQGSGVCVKHGEPLKSWQQLTQQYAIKQVHFNRDYEPYALSRDTAIRAFLDAKGVTVVDHKDQVIFEQNEVEKGAGGPYTVFTPYSRKWLSQLTDTQSYDCRTGQARDFYKWKAPQPLTLAELGFTASPEFEFPASKVDLKILSDYAEARNLPAAQGTSRLGVHLRFGTVSIRDLVREAKKREASVWLSELIWREFFMQILWHFPHVVGAPFRHQYEKIQFRHDRQEFARWCEGQTGYPIVDAGIRELNATGFMHNRVRMIAGSFLVKHLLIDWRWGESYFARKLLDFDLASNNGNWQWVAGTGCDAAPYFRVFNPETQTKKFDAKKEYIRKWVPEIDSARYPKPIVDHAEARARVLRAYAKGLGKKAPEPTR